MEEISKNQIIEVLSKIMDLSRGKDIYNSGNVADIAIKDNNVQVTLEVESHRAKAFEVIRKEVEKAINKIPKVTKTLNYVKYSARPLTNWGILIFFDAEFEFLVVLVLGIQNLAF